MFSEDAQSDIFSYKLHKSEVNTIDLTEPVFDGKAGSLPAESFPISRSPPDPEILKEGCISKQKKRKSGAEEILLGLKKRQTSGKMRDEQMKLAIKLAEFEEVNDELEALQADSELAHLSTVSLPADWLKTPNERTDWARVSEDLYGSKNAAASECLAKVTKLTDCMKHMYIEAHPHFLRSWYLEDLAPQASSQGVRLASVDTLPPGAIAITRSGTRELVAAEGQYMSLSNRRNSLRYIYVQCASETAALLADSGLARRVAAVNQVLEGQVTLLILDTEKYFKKGKPQIELETAIVDLLVALEVDTLVMKSPEELVSTILQLTKAVAEEPAKLAKRAVDEQADFYMRGDNKNCVTVDQQGNGLSRAWQQMLSILPHSSLEVGRAVDSHLPTPRLMAEAVSTDAGVECLGNIGVSRSAVPGARARRLGNEMANKMAVLFSTTDGDLVLD